tara:strand:+ start:5339 stop:6484 length:1146 start_codon:yes stop_codon:yes gene_type:complete
MDDYNITSLNNSQQEWAIKLLNIITPYITEGIYSIFDEAYKLCLENREKEKYLMTFQNLLSRIPKWNNSIIEAETKRIVEKSKCTYLEDLISCVHISHLKILTSMRVSKTQKKININVPELKDFIHKVYINCGRKLYTVVYLFERNVEPLILQKNKKEIEDHVNNSILNAIRESIPVEEILKAYMDESTDLIANVNKEVIVEEQKDPTDNTMSKKLVVNESEISEESKNDDDSVVIKSVSPVSESIAPVIETNVVPVVSSIPEKDALAIEPHVPASDAVVVTDESIQNTDNNLKLSFSEVDKSISVDKIEQDVNAPKDLETLEKISEINNKKRKEEEEDDYEEEKLVISNETIKLDTLDINEIPVKLNDKNPLLSDIEILT